MRSRLAISSSRAVSRKISAIVLIHPFSTNSSIWRSPSPSISIALRLAKCLSRSSRCASQVKPPVQRRTASPSGRIAGCWQTGHVSGKMKSRSLPSRRDSITRTIWGITSPARCRITLSPMRIFLRRTSSSLCKVAFDTVTPPTSTGSRRATGVKAPVLPTCMSISRSVVSACSAANLCAMAQRGARLTCPSRCCQSCRLTL